MDKFDPQSLPQTKATWYFTSRRLRIWVLDDDQEPQRPHLTVLMDMQDGMIRSSQLNITPTQELAQALIIEAMTKSEQKHGLTPQRPARIFFEDRTWREALTPFLREMGVESKYRSIPDLSNELFADVEKHLEPDFPDIPGLLSIKGVNTKMVKSLFEAAADFYRSEPWIELSNEDVLAITVSPQKEPWYAIVMGQGGVEYGLALYKSWEDVIRQTRSIENAEDYLLSSDHHALSFDEITEVSFDDLDAIENYGWEIAAPSAYPVPIVYTSSEAFIRPDRETLLWYTAAMRAIPQFIANELAPKETGKSLPIESKLRVNTAVGDVSVHIKYPGGELPKGARMYREPTLIDMIEPRDPPFNPRAMEGDIADMTAGLRDDEPLGPKVVEAQELMYQAWKESNPAQRITLAHQALKTSPDCADAYVLLAEEEAEDIEQSSEFFRQGIEAGKRALGEKYFQENAGHFWGLIETRPYMRAMEGLANCLWNLDQNQEALEIYREMLRLNPGDNQGIRYILVDLLLTLQRDSELEALLEEYAEDWSAIWTYTRALLEFRKFGDKPKARTSLHEAIDQNSHVPEYLTGSKRIPNRLPDMIGRGDEQEAIAYAANHLNYWRSTPGAVDWLKKQASGKAIRKRQAARTGNLKPGDSVVVKQGVIDPDDGTDLGGWQGRVVEVDVRGRWPMVQVAWDGPTLQGMEPEYIQLAAQEGMDWSEYILPPGDLTKKKARDTLKEREEILEQIADKYAYAHLGEQGQRIQAVIQDIDSNNEIDLYKAWDEHLRKYMQLPLQAIFAEPVSGSRFRPDDKVRITAFETMDNDEGVMVRVEKGKRNEIIPLAALEPGEENTPSMELFEDYITWCIGA